MRAVAPVVAVTVVSMLFGPLAQAQTSPDDEPYPAPPGEGGPPPPAVAPAPPPPGAPPAPGFVAQPPSPREFDQMLRYDPEYRAAKGRRLGGILVSSIGGGLGAIFAIMFGVVAAICSGVDSSSSCSDMSHVAIGSLIVAGVSLGVGIPLAISGQSRMNEVRARRARDFLPQPTVSFSPGGARLQGVWRF